MDFWISEWISGFQIGFLDFIVDFWISGFQFGFLPTVYEISFVTDPSLTSGNIKRLSPKSVHSPVHSPVQSPESRFYTNPLTTGYFFAPLIKTVMRLFTAASNYSQLWLC